TLSVSIHPHGYAGTCTQRCKQEFERVRSGISATHIKWLVGLEQMTAHRYVLSISGFPAFHDYNSRHRSLLLRPKVENLSQLHLRSELYVVSSLSDRLVVFAAYSSVQ